MYVWPFKRKETLSVPERMKEMENYIDALDPSWRFNDVYLILVLNNYNTSAKHENGNIIKDQQFHNNVPLFQLGKCLCSSKQNLALDHKITEIYFSSSYFSITKVLWENTKQLKYNFSSDFPPLSCTLRVSVINGTTSFVWTQKLLTNQKHFTKWFVQLLLV